MVLRIPMPSGPGVSKTIVVSLPNALPQQMSLSRNFATGGEAKPTLLTGLQTSFKAGHH
jgi:hypothetical protein